MASMTHTKQQRADWHAGKRKGQELSIPSAIKALRSGNLRGANTPPRFKKGMTYKPLPEARR